VKAGSNLVVSGGPLLVRDWMAQVRALARRGIRVVWVTSGAIATASERLGFRAKSRTLAQKQALSAVGQPRVMDLYNLALANFGLQGAQILLTYDDLADRGRRRNFQGTVAQLVRWGHVPVLNENDAVATEEIRFGDNDRLSALVAHAVGAERLVILTDVDGLYERDPRRHPGAKLVREVPRVTPAMLARLRKDGGTGSSRGTGGMLSKVTAASIAARAGVETWLARGDRAGVLLDVLAGKLSSGTRFVSTRGSR